MTANFCGSCGSTLLSGARFCPHCGKAVAHASAPPQQPAQQPAQQPVPQPAQQPAPYAAPQPQPPGDSTQVRRAFVPPPPPPADHRRLWIMIGSAAFAIVLLGLGTAAYLTIHRQHHGGTASATGSAASPGDQARAAVRNAYGNYYFGRCEQATKFIDAPHDQVLSQCQGEAQDVAKIDVGKATVTGDKATVAVVVTPKGQGSSASPVDLTVHTVKTSDGWKVLLSSQ